MRLVRSLDPVAQNTDRAMPACQADFSQSLQPARVSEQSLHSGKLLSALRTLQTIHLLFAVPSLSKGPTMLLTGSSRIASSSRIAPLTITIVLLAVLSSLTSDCQAQRRRFVLGQEVGRFLGVYHGPGYHCANPGQNSDYYNPYSDHNSRMTTGNYPLNRSQGGFSNFDTDSVPYRSYTNRDQNQHSVFESLPGQTLQPKFEPAVDRNRKKSDADFDSDFNSNSDLDFDPVEDFENESGSGSRTKSNVDSFSTLDDLDSKELAGENDGDFDALKSTFDDIQRGEANRPNPLGVGDDFLN